MRLKRKINQKISSAFLIALLGCCFSVFARESDFSDNVLSKKDPTLDSAANSIEDSAENGESTPHPSAEDWLEKLSYTLRRTNFDVSFVVSRQFKTEPYRWRHAVVSGLELEQLSLLNGSGSETVRKGNQVSYFEPSTVPYTLIASNISGPIPDIFYQSNDLIEGSYELILQGRERVAGRLAQQIRIQPRVKNRYSYTVYLDSETAMLLKLVTMLPDNQQIEDLQVTSIEINQDPDKQLLNLIDAELPEPSVPKAEDHSFSWQLAWLPEGFERYASNKHRLAIYRKLVEQQLFTDGIASFSVYMAQSRLPLTETSTFQRGATSIVQRPLGNYELTVIGNIPLDTASQVAQSLVLTTP